jgi:small subunit ribosomal protein S4e
MIMTMKRMMAPDFWPIQKKTKKFVVQLKPGPHNMQACMPLGVIIREILGYAKTMTEVRAILNAGHVRIDGVVRNERGFPVGLMDVLSIGDEHYRVAVGKRGLCLEKINSSEAGLKLLRIEDKKHVSGRRVQLNFHDGRNLLVAKDEYKTGDVVVFDLAKKSIKETLKLSKDSLALVIGGNNIGSMGKIEEIVVTKSSMPNKITVNLGERKIILPKNYIFVVGKSAPVVSLGERNEKH